MLSSVKPWFCGELMMGVVFLASISTPIHAQESTKKANAAAVDESDETKLKGRLPAYYKEVVDAQQRDKIYALQSDYANKIAPLQEQIKKLVADRDAAIEKVLTAEQQAKLKKIRDESNSKRKTAGLGPATKETAKKPEEKKSE